MKRFIIAHNSKSIDGAQKGSSAITLGCVLRVCCLCLHSDFPHAH